MSFKLFRELIAYIANLFEGQPIQAEQVGREWDRICVALREEGTW